MKTAEQIVARINKIKDQDVFGFETSDLLVRLPFEEAKQFLKESTTADDWGKSESTKDPLEELKEYMPFAWDKANNCRGISASRSISHMTSWLWLAGEDEFLKSVNNLDDYDHYGKPQLRAICEHFGIDWKQYDDGRWANGEEGEGVGPDDVPSVVVAKQS